MGCRCCRSSVNTICGRIMIGMSLSSSVNTICGRIMIGLSLSSVSKHNMRSCYDWVVVVFFRLLAQHVVVLWLDCRCCRPSVNIICCRIMIGLSLLSSVSKHNMWSYYDWVVVVFVSKHNMRSCYDWVVVVVFRLLTQYVVVLWLGCRCCRPSVNTIWGHNTTTYCVYWRTTTTTTQS